MSSSGNGGGGIIPSEPSRAGWDQIGRGIVWGLFVAFGDSTILF